MVAQYADQAPVITDSEILRYAALYTDEEENYKYSLSGKRLETNIHGVWKNKPNQIDWKPDEVPDDVDWKNMNQQDRAL